MAKYVFVSGGVASGLGKGITAASLGRLLKARGRKVTLKKFDPYFNVDSSNLSPYQHGEVFVTEDGGESDLVIGHYERFIDENLNKSSDITSGQIYSAVIDNERKGLYNGGTVQVVPHVTDEIKKRVLAPTDADIVIVEIGGTVGDIECHPFLEAIRQCRRQLGKSNAVFVHVTLVPYIEVSHEQKTKPTQHSVKELQNLGIQPDVIICRSDYELDLSSRNKMSLFCNVDKDCILQSLTTENIYEVPLRLEEQGLASVVLRKLSLEDSEPDLRSQREYFEKKEELAKRKGGLKIAVLGKYVEKHDAYISLIEALGHSSIALDEKVSVTYISSERINEKNVSRLSDFDGVIIPAGFGVRGFDGKVTAAHYVRTNGIPALMLGLGAQAALVEYARDVLGMPNASSTEFDPDTCAPVVTSLVTPPVFRKGAFASKLKKGSRLEKAYGKTLVSERHRHKYDFNKDYAEAFEKHGLEFTAFASDGTPEAFELCGGKFFVGVIFRPEFKSRPNRPHPLISAFLLSCKDKA